MNHPADDFITVRNFPVNFHVLRDKDGLYLIDGGFIRAEQRLQQVLISRGWEKEPILGVIATHGHLDHILNVGRIARKHGAWIAAPRLDASHYSGNPTYTGWSRITGILEALGRPLLGFEPFTPDRLLDDGDVIDVWHGLRAVHLPGHTAGHTGYYCDKLGLLFSGDLFASYKHFTHLPPWFFNHGQKAMIESLQRAIRLDPQEVIPNHGDHATPEIHQARLRKLEASVLPARD